MTEKWTVPLRKTGLAVIACVNAFNQTIQCLHGYERLKQSSHYSRWLISRRRDSTDRFCHSSSSRESVSLVISDFIKCCWLLIGCKAWVMGKSEECQGSEAHWKGKSLSCKGKIKRTSPCRCICVRPLE